MSEPYSLRESLPQSVFGQATRGLASYRNFPVFSWPWMWRRTVIFGPIALGLGTIGGINVFLQTQDSSLAARMLSLSVPAWLGSVMLGPALAAWVRERRFTPRVENWSVVAAIATGVLIVMLLQYALTVFTREFVVPRMLQEGFVTAQALSVGRRPGVIAANVALLLLVFTALGGGLALRTFFSERQRWQEHEHEREIQQLRLQRDESQRRLTVLQAQVEPHFLFNTLASVRSLIKGDPRRAEATIDALVDHLRATLPKLRDAAGEAQTTLATQVDICRSYLEVMRVRMGERLSCTIDVPADLSAAAFPPLMLISLVENAIKHGVEPKPGPCCITIAARRVDGAAGAALEVSVADDGAGLSLGVGNGIGLSNIRAQLATHFGDRGRLSLDALPNGGAIAKLTVPLETIQP